MTEFLSGLWAALPWVVVVLLGFSGLNMLRRIEALESLMADYIDILVPDEDVMS